MNKFYKINKNINNFEMIKIKGPSAILIGPEGDFSPLEIEMALQNQYKAVNLGNTRLRTETAALVAVHTIYLKY